MTAARASVRSEVVSTELGLERLARQWEQLRQQSPTATPFQSPAWLIPWWRAFGVGELHLVCLYADEHLVGLVPLFVRRLHGAPPQLRLLGTGNTDHLDALVEPGYEDELAEVMAECLAALRSRVKDAEFEQLPRTSILLRMPAEWRAEQVPGEPCPSLTLGGRAELDAVLPRRFASKLRQYRRRLARTGHVELETAEGTCARAEMLFDDVVRLHAAAWDARGVAGALAEPQVQRFHREVVRAAQRCGLLDLHALRLDGRVVAAYYGFRDAGRAYYYLGGFDPSLRSLSVGSVMLSAALEAAIRRGAAEFDFLRGSEAYKYRWGARDRRTERVRLVP